jgi:hypothetical protein
MFLRKYAEHISIYIMTEIQIESKSSTIFRNALLSTERGAEEAQDFCEEFRMNYLASQYELRNGRARAICEEHIFSAQFVLQKAAERHFELLAHTVGTMNGMFSESEIRALLDSGCGPLWTWRPGISLAGAIADNRGVEDLDELEEGCELKVLLIKLNSLTSPQTLALTDLCERFWRTPSGAPLWDTFESMGLELTQ